MKIGLITDAPYHNLALMKISSYHKNLGDEVIITKNPSDIFNVDKSYASWLFQPSFQANVIGGTGYDPSIKLPENIDKCVPDYSIYPIDYSLGITWAYCPRKCEFCVVPHQNNDKKHTSIWSFHNKKFTKICLLNNNTFSDLQWYETFREIWDANLIVIDQNGYDLRLLDEEKAMVLKMTKFEGAIHFAFDNINDETKIRNGLKILKNIHIKNPIQIYVLVGFYNKHIEQSDIDRCTILKEYGFDPFIMVYNRHKNSEENTMRQLNQFERMVNRVFSWRKIGFKQAWDNYCR